ncbi:hypothetical protein [Enterococcus sp. AZ109]|uniref:hypothetical protein n=1 Tax=Enterococcus sp. AZ109 TaxID=2774634 RepID=UPI003F1F4A7A
MRKGKGYIFFESLVSLSLLVGMTYGYLMTSIQLQKQTKHQLEKIEAYRDHYIIIHHQRLYPDEN